MKESANAGTLAELKQETAVTRSDHWNGDLPNLYEAEVSNIELSSTYWNPEVEGEVKRVFFDNIGIAKVPDMQDKDLLVELEVVYMVEQMPDGTLQGIMNGAKALVSTIKQRGVQPREGLQITYLGKAQGKSGFKYDNFSIRRLT